MSRDIEAILDAYSRGVISNWQGADRLGPPHTVADLIVMTVASGRPLPDPDGPFERDQFARACRHYGIEPPLEMVDPGKDAAA